MESEFEKWERAGELEIKLLAAIAEADVKYAEAAHERAKAQNIAAATEAARIADAHLSFTPRAGKKRQYKLAQEKKQLAENARWLTILKSGSITTPGSCAEVWRAWQWLLGKARDGRWSVAYFAALPAAAIGPENVRVTTVKKPAPPDFPPGSSLVQVVAWMTGNFAMPVQGSPLHAEIVKVLTLVETAQDEWLAKLEEWEFKAATAERAELDVLKDLLGVALVAGGK